MKNLEFVEQVTDGSPTTINLSYFPVGTKVFIRRPQFVNVHMTEAEASVLLTLLQYVGGHMLKTARCHADSLSKKLVAAGVEVHPDHRHGEFVDKDLGDCIFIKAKP